MAEEFDQRGRLIGDFGGKMETLGPAASFKHADERTNTLSLSEYGILG